MSGWTAEERAIDVERTLLSDLQKVDGVSREQTCARWVKNNVRDHIRQAEAAARKAALEEAAQLAETRFVEGRSSALHGAGLDIAKALRALAESDKP